MKPKTLTRRNALKFIQARAGKIFAVKFIKRTTGEEREMVCRQGVKAHLAANPSKPGIDFKANDLIPVFDMNASPPVPKDKLLARDFKPVKGAYRSIPKEGITAIKIGGEWYEVK